MLPFLLESEKHHGSCHNASKPLVLEHIGLTSKHVDLAFVSCSAGVFAGGSVGEFESFPEFEGSCYSDSQICRLS